jgi:hypothetical protein
MAGMTDQALVPFSVFRFPFSVKSTYNFITLHISFVTFERVAWLNHSGSFADYNRKIPEKNLFPPRRGRLGVKIIKLFVKKGG